VVRKNKVSKHIPFDGQASLINIGKKLKLKKAASMHYTSTFDFNSDHAFIILITGFNLMQRNVH
jgi:hypothetical protein